MELQPNAIITRAQMATVISRFSQHGFARKKAISEGIDLIYPSDEQKTICPKRDFYVIGEFQTGVTIPNDAVCEIKVISEQTGQLMRLVV